MAKSYLDAAGLNYLIGRIKDGRYNTASDGAVSTTGFIVGAASTVPATGIQGIIPLKNMPAGALERAVTVTTLADMYKLTTSAVQLGDTVIVTQGAQDSSGNFISKMFIVVDETKLTSADGYNEYASGTASRALSADNAANATHAINADVAGTTTGNASTATKLAAAFTLTVAGAVTGSVSIDGSKGVTLNTTLSNLASNKVTALTGYAKGTAASFQALATSDSLNSALGKLQRNMDFLLRSIDVYATEDVEGTTQPATNIAFTTANYLGKLRIRGAGATTITANQTLSQILIRSTDANVDQTLEASNGSYPILLAGTGTSTSTATFNGGTKRNNYFFYNPSTHLLTLAGTTGGTYGTILANVGSTSVPLTFYGTLKGNADTATNATNAVNATNATNAVNAQNDGSGNNIVATYATKESLITGELSIASITNAKIDEMIAGTWTA